MFEWEPRVSAAEWGPRNVTRNEVWHWSLSYFLELEHLFTCQWLFKHLRHRQLFHTHTQVSDNHQHSKISFISRLYLSLIFANLCVQYYDMQDNAHTHTRYTFELHNVIIEQCSGAEFKIRTICHAETCENWFDLVNSCNYCVRQTRENYQVG